MNKSKELKELRKSCANKGRLCRSSSFLIGRSTTVTLPSALFRSAHFLNCRLDSAPAASHSEGSESLFRPIFRPGLCGHAYSSLVLRRISLQIQKLCIKYNTAWIRNFYTYNPHALSRWCTRTCWTLEIDIVLKLQYYRLWSVRFGVQVSWRCEWSRSSEGAMANRLRRRTSDQTVLGSNPAVAAALSPWTRLFTPICPKEKPSH